MAVMIPWVALSSLAGFGKRAEADDGGPSRAECVQAYEGSQLQRRNQALLEARKGFQTCASEGCPALARADCLTWLSEVDSAIPSVVVEGKTDEAAVFDVTVEVDGAVVATVLDGKAIELDPGVHTFTFEREGQQALHEKIILREGEKSRRLVADWSTPKAPAAAFVPPAIARTERPIPVATYALGGVALLGLADFVIAGVVGNQKKNDLQSSGCAPFCSMDQVSTVKIPYAVADVGLAISLVAAAAGTVVFIARPERPLPQVSFGVNPSPTGALFVCHAGF